MKNILINPASLISDASLFLIAILILVACGGPNTDSPVDDPGLEKSTGAKYWNAVLM